MATSSTAEGQHAVNVSCAVEYEELSFKSRHEVTVVCTLEAPLMQDQDRESRAPIDLIALIDKSGSMQGTKLEMVKKTMNFVLQQLKPSDRLGIVVYDSFVSELLPLTTMTADHKEQALHLIKEIRAGTSTNLSGALFKGIEILTKRTEKKDVSSVLLFTDGLANQGITKAPQIVGTMEKQLGNFKGVCTVFTFGFGADHSPEMLRAIAEAGKGMYYFVERDDDIPQAFGDCLGGLLSVVAQNLELTIEAVEPGVEIKHINGSHHVLSKTATKVKINLGDIYSEERRNLVCTVSLPAKEKPSAQRDFFLRFNLEYFHLLEGQTQRRFADAYISRPECTPLNQTVNPLVEVQLSRIQALKAMEEAKQAAEKGDLTQARTILQTGMNKVSKVQTSNIVSEGLMVDMRDCLQDLQSERDYKQKGKQKLMQNAMVHSRERAVHTNDCYANTRKKATKAAFL